MTRLSLLILIVLAVLVGGICIVSASNNLPPLSGIVDSIQEAFGPSRSADSPPPNDFTPSRQTPAGNGNTAMPSYDDLPPGICAERLLITDSDILGATTASQGAPGESTSTLLWSPSGSQGRGGSSYTQAYQPFLTGFGSSSGSSGVLAWFPSSGLGSSSSGGSDSSGGGSTQGSNSTVPLQLQPSFSPTSSGTPGVSPGETGGPSTSGSPVSGYSPELAYTPSLEDVLGGLPLSGDTGDGQDPGLPVSTPEPGTLALGAIALAAFASRRKRLTPR